MCWRCVSSNNWTDAPRHVCGILRKRSSRSRIVEQVDTRPIPKDQHHSRWRPGKARIESVGILENRSKPKNVGSCRGCRRLLLQAAPVTVSIQRNSERKQIIALGESPGHSGLLGKRLRVDLGKFGREYKQAAFFDKRFLTDDPTLE